MDFTLIKYTELLQAQKDKDYRFVTFEQYCIDKGTLSEHKYVILRFANLNAHHDVGIHGIDTEIAQHLIDILKPHGRIYITSYFRT